VSAWGAGGAIAREDEHVRRQIEELLASHAGWSGSVRSVVASPSRFAHRSAADILTVELEDGVTIRLFRKRRGPEEAAHPDKLIRDREPLVYSELLSGAVLPVPTFYGWSSDEAAGRHDLLLEYIDGWSLQYQDLDHWTTAARWLARLHAEPALRGDRLERHGFLLRLDAAYLRAWAERAVTAAGAVSATLSRRLERVVADHGAIADLLASQPPTLVHNDLAPKNVIADVSRAPARICFVDWEMAGVGCGLIDLAHLMHGLSPDDEARMRAAYCAELAGAGLLPTGRELGRLLSACALHNAVYRLAHVRAWGIERGAVARWIDDAASLRGAV
jgi:aminoglycoside phosphotransferase (APT) family kinase protein